MLTPRASTEDNQILREMPVWLVRERVIISVKMIIEELFAEVFICVAKMLLANEHRITKRNEFKPSAIFYSNISSFFILCDINGEYKFVALHTFMHLNPVVSVR